MSRILFILAFFFVRLHFYFRISGYVVFSRGDTYSTGLDCHVFSGALAIEFRAGAVGKTNKPEVPSISTVVVVYRLRVLHPP